MDSLKQIVIRWGTSVVYLMKHADPEDQDPAKENQEHSVLHLKDTVVTQIPVHFMAKTKKKYVDKNPSVRICKLAMEEVLNVQFLHQSTTEFHVKIVQKFARLVNVMDQFVQCSDWRTAFSLKGSRMNCVSSLVSRMEVSFSFVSSPCNPICEF